MEQIKMALFDFSRNKGRTFLTSLGILIGVLSVILLVSFGLGLKRYIDQQFESIAPNLLRIVPGKVLQEGGGFRVGPGSISSIRFDEEDVQKIKRVEHLDYVIPTFTKTVTARAGKNSELTDFFSSSEDLFRGLNVEAEYGEIFTKADVDKRIKVAVLGPTIAKKLFADPQLAIGNDIRIETQSFKVIGITKAKGGGGFGGPDFDSYIYIPYKAGYVFDPDKKFLAIIAKVNSEEHIDRAKVDIEDLMLKRYSEDDFSVIKQTDLLNAITSIFSVINLVLVAIAAISLVVGGIGIMNIMYVTVTERIKEIGIRRAIGARKSDILYQFLVESVILSLFGGTAGLILAWIIVFFIQKFFPAYINVQTVALALGVSTIIGVVFGVFPAKKAADLTPVEAIRYE